MKHCLNTLQKGGKLKSKSKFNMNHIKSTVPYMFCAGAALRGKTWDYSMGPAAIGKPQRTVLLIHYVWEGGPKPKIVKS